MDNLISSKQRTTEWYDARRGQVGASRIADIMARTKSGTAASRKNYMCELLCARLTGNDLDQYESEAMRWGTEHEPEARAVYEATTGNIVEECGFIVHPTIIGAGASPDGLVGSDGVLEIKCPGTSAHLETLLENHIETKYQYQMAWQIECTARKWADFVSYDPRLPEKLSVKVIRFIPEKALLDDIRAGVIQFLKELDEMERRLRSIKGG
jgi:putative phage-type endonuclease